MSVLCSICQDFLTERPQTFQPTNESEAKIICALRCGHIFHRVCVKQWFQTTAGQDHVQDRRHGAGDQITGRCPCCKVFDSLSTALRVFLTGDEDSNNVVEQRKNLEAVTRDNQKLTVELKRAKRNLGKIKTDLEVEKLANDMLKMKCGELLSKAQAVQEELDEEFHLKTALKNSVQTEMKKLAQDNAQALRRMAEMEVREEELIEENEALKVARHTAFARGQIFQESMQEIPEDDPSIAGTNKGITVGTSRDTQTSDGESPSSSPLFSCQKRQNVMFLQNIYSIAAESD